MTVHQARPDDVLRLADLIYHLSEHTRYLRFFRPLPLSLARTSSEARRMVQQTPERVITLIATVQTDRFAEAIAVAELVRDLAAPQRGEVAVLVRNNYQRSGVGSVHQPDHSLCSLCSLWLKRR